MTERFESKSRQFSIEKAQETDAEMLAVQLANLIADVFVDTHIGMNSLTEEELRLFVGPGFRYRTRLHNYHGILGAYRSQFFIARSEGEVCGFSEAYIDDKRQEQWVNGLYVAKERQNQGIGTQLLQSSLNALVSAQPVHLWVVEGVPAEHLYTNRFGFQQTETEDYLPIANGKSLRRKRLLRPPQRRTSI